MGTEILRRLLPLPPVFAPGFGEQFVVLVLPDDSPDSFVVQDVSTVEDMGSLWRDMDKFYMGRREG